MAGVTWKATFTMARSAPSTARPLRCAGNTGNLGYGDLPRGGLLATAGGLVFGSDTSRLFAFRELHFFSQPVSRFTLSRTSGTPFHNSGMSNSSVNTLGFSS